MVVAKQDTLGKLLVGTNRLRVPRYQRKYSWKREQWELLWGDVVRLARERLKRPSETHFVGSVVLARQVGPSRFPADGLLVVDGQQRIVTLSLLLCAIRDQNYQFSSRRIETRIRRCLSWSDPTSASGQDLIDLLKVVPTEDDRDAFLWMVFGAEHHPKHHVFAAYSYFLDELTRLEENRERGQAKITVEDIALAVLDGIECVQITAEEEDNVHRIFESLNNRGMVLTQADLIRNYVFMRLEGSKNDGHFHEFTWMPRFEKPFTAEELTMLFWLDLVRTDVTVQQTRTYEAQQKRLERLTTPAKLRNELDRIADYGEHWQLILHPERENSLKVRRRLQRLNDWGTTTVYPVLMYLLEQRAHGQAGTSEIARAMLILESYFVRRVLVGQGTMNMNHVLLSAPKAMERAKGDDALDVVLRRYLSEAKPALATDDEVKSAILHARFYGRGRAPQRTLVLKWIDESFGDDHVEHQSKLTIEHIMPRNLNAAWRKELKHGLKPGENVAELHKELLDTLGNLTLLTQEKNSGIGTRSFAKKKLDIKQTHLRMNAEITRKVRWGPKQIRDRGHELAEIAVGIWPGPV